MDIYLITCITTNKKYVGQTNQIDSKGLPYGYKKRFASHIASSINGSNNCLKLKHSMCKHGPDNHKIDLITTCSENESDGLETYYIKLYDTLHPTGLNLESGGNKNKKLSDITKQKMSISRMNHPNYLKYDSPLKISKGLVKYNDDNPKIKYDHNGELLPKYISKVIVNGEIKGYSAFIHHNKKRKKLTSKNISNDDKLSLIKEFVLTNE